MKHNTIFEVRDVDYSYSMDQKVLDNINFSVSPGERIALLGANASGKSTLLHLLGGLYFPDNGSVTAFDTILTEESVETPPFSRFFRRRVGLLFQDSDAQLFCTTVEDELAFGPLQLRLSAADVERRVNDILGLFGIEHLRHRSPQTLSGGEKKKVALASLITYSPSVILLDEPSLGLDPRSHQWLMEFLDALSDYGITLITASHSLGLVAEVSNRALVLSEDHRLVYDGPTASALSNLELMLSANLIHAHAHRHDGKTHLHPHLHEIWHDHDHVS